MNAYDYLVKLVQVEDVASFKWRNMPNAESPKVEHLLNQIRAIRKRHSNTNLQGYTYKFDGNRTNIVVFFPASRETDLTIGFSAHHDVANPKCDNVFDNLASVSHLLAMIEDCAQHPPAYHNVLFVLTDGEEVGGKGAQHFGKVLNRTDHKFGNIFTIINLELTAAGTHYWTDDSGSLGSVIFKKATQEYTKATHLTIGCPFNDSDPFRRANIDSACVGMISRNTVQRIKKSKDVMPAIWGICHSNMDNLHLAKAKDMQKFTDLLTYIAQGCWNDIIRDYEYREPVNQRIDLVPIGHGSYMSKAKRSNKPSTINSQSRTYKSWWEEVEPPY